MRTRRVMLGIVATGLLCSPAARAAQVDAGALRVAADGGTFAQPGAPDATLE
ncbi:MAG: hypothetical protein H0V81_12600, partial [Solirubrobacterales bacterium]|nr:hypothetical protein [Solirubrobacterales bacterium]